MNTSSVIRFRFRFSITDVLLSQRDTSHKWSRQNELTVVFFTDELREEFRTVDFNHIPDLGRLPTCQVVPHPGAAWGRSRETHTVGVSLKKERTEHSLSVTSSFNCQHITSCVSILHTLKKITHSMFSAEIDTVFTTKFDWQSMKFQRETWEIQKNCAHAFTELIDWQWTYLVARQHGFLTTGEHFNDP